MTEMCRSCPNRTYLVQDQKHTVAVADLAHSTEVAGDWWHCARSCSDDRFSDERDDRFGADAQDFLLERVSCPARVCRRRLARFGKAVFETRIDERYIEEQRLIGSAAPGASTCCKRAERIAMVTLTSGNDSAAAGIPPL